MGSVGVPTHAINELKVYCAVKYLILNFPWECTYMCAHWVLPAGAVQDKDMGAWAGRGHWAERGGGRAFPPLGLLPPTLHPCLGQLSAAQPLKS